jgi:hypothetical protein
MFPSSLKTGMTTLYVGRDGDDAADCTEGAQPSTAGPWRGASPFRDNRVAFDGGDRKSMRVQICPLHRGTAYTPSVRRPGLGILVSLAMAACEGEPPKAPGEEPADAGEVCAMGGRATRTCRPGLRCKSKIASSAPMTLKERGEDAFSSVAGGPCGGIAGYHCVEGLACDIGSEPARADGMGTCVSTNVCMP